MCEPSFRSASAPEGAECIVYPLNEEELREPTQSRLRLVGHKHLGPRKSTNPPDAELRTILLSNEDHQMGTIKALRHLGKSDHAVIRFAFTFRWLTFQSKAEAFDLSLEPTFGTSATCLLAGYGLLIVTQSGSPRTLHRGLHQAGRPAFVSRKKLTQQNNQLPHHSISSIPDERSKWFPRFRFTGMESEKSEFRIIRGLCKRGKTSALRFEKTQLIS